MMWNGVVRLEAVHRSAGALDARLDLLSERVADLLRWHWVVHVERQNTQRSEGYDAIVEQSDGRRLRWDALVGDSEVCWVSRNDRPSACCGKVRVRGNGWRVPERAMTIFNDLVKVPSKMAFWAASGVVAAVACESRRSRQQRFEQTRRKLRTQDHVQVRSKSGRKE